MSDIKLEVIESCINDVVIINQAKFDKDVAHLCFRIGEGVLEDIKKRLSGSYHVSLSALILYALNSLESEGAKLILDTNGYNVVPKSKEDYRVYVNLSVKRDYSKAVSFRIPKNLKQRLKDACNQKHTVSVEGLVRYSLERLKQRSQCLLIRNNQP